MWDSLPWFVQLAIQVASVVFLLEVAAVLFFALLSLMKFLQLGTDLLQIAKTHRQEKTEK